MPQFVNRDLLEDEPWPPILPDVDTAAIEAETPELSVIANSMLYGFMTDFAPTIPTTASLPSLQRRDIMYQMIDTVQQPHVKRIIHGDMKLDNMLLLDKQGKLRLFEFR